MAEYINREAVNRISFTDAVLIDGEVRIEKIALVRDIEKLPAAAEVNHIAQACNQETAERRYR